MRLYKLHYLQFWDYHKDTVIQADDDQDAKCQAIRYDLQCNRKQEQATIKALNAYEHYTGSDNFRRRVLLDDYESLRDEPIDHKYVLTPLSEYEDPLEF